MDNINYSVKKVNLYEQIADQLETAILAPDSFPEEKLPSEQTLAERFGVSRTVIREALKLLKERDLVDMRTGEGAFIVRPHSSSVTSVMNRIIQVDNIDDAQVHEARLALETASSRLAALNAGPEDIARLRAILDEMAEKKDDLPRRIQLDADFHIAVAASSKNRIMEIFVSVMNSLMKDFISRGIQYPGGNEDGIQRHRAIFQAIADHDPQRAEREMAEHLKVSRHNVETVEQQGRA